MEFNFKPLNKTKNLLKKSSPKQIQKALFAVKGEWGALKAEKFHFRLKQQRKHDRRGN